MVQLSCFHLCLPPGFLGALLQLLTLIIKCVCNKHTAILTLTHSLSVDISLYYTHTIGRLIYHFVNGVKTRSSRAAELLLPQIIF